MSRLTEVVENHENLNDLQSILKHYAVSAEFVSFSLIEQFKKRNEGEQETEKDGESMELDQQYTAELIDDLTQFHARF